MYTYMYMYMYMYMNMYMYNQIKIRPGNLYQGVISLERPCTSTRRIKKVSCLFLSFPMLCCVVWCMCVRCVCAASVGVVSLISFILSSLLLSLLLSSLLLFFSSLSSSLSPPSSLLSFFLAAGRCITEKAVDLPQRVHVLLLTTISSRFSHVDVTQHVKKCLKLRREA